MSDWQQKIKAQIAQLNVLADVWKKTDRCSIYKDAADTMQALLDVAVAAAKCHPHMCGKVFDPMRVEEFEKAYDKLREVGDGN